MGAGLNICEGKSVKYAVKISSSQLGTPYYVLVTKILLINTSFQTSGDSERTICEETETQVSLVEDLCNEETPIPEGTRTDTAVSTTDRRKIDTPPRNLKRTLPTKQIANEDPRIAAAFDVMQSCVQQRDSCDIYGEHVAMKLRTYTKTTQNMVQHLFNNILFKADMGQYNQTGSSGLHSPTGDSTAFSPSGSCFSYQSEFDSTTTTPVPLVSTPMYSTTTSNKLHIVPPLPQRENTDNTNGSFIQQPITTVENAASYLSNFKPPESEDNYTMTCI